MCPFPERGVIIHRYTLFLYSYNARKKTVYRSPNCLLLSLIFITFEWRQKFKTFSISQAEVKYR